MKHERKGYRLFKPARYEPCTDVVPAGAVIDPFAPTAPQRRRFARWGSDDKQKTRVVRARKGEHAGADLAVLDTDTWYAEQRAEREQSDYLCDKRHNGRVLTFHSLRHSYIANLKRAGVPLTTAMQLARHSDPKLTARRYGTLGLHDLAGAVARLPIFTPPAEAAIREGTNDAPVNAANPPVVSAVCLAQTGTRRATLVDFAGRQDSAKRCAETPESLAENAGKTGACARSSAGQSGGFLNRRSRVRITPGALPPCAAQRRTEAAWGTPTIL